MCTSFIDRTFTNTAVKVRTFAYMYTFGSLPVYVDKRKYALTIDGKEQITDYSSLSIYIKNNFSSGCV